METGARALMLALGDEVLALDAEMVREILDPVPATRVAGAKSFVPFLINVRGNIVPLADLRVRFGMPPCADTRDTRIVVIETHLGGDLVVLGLIADKVHEVVEIAPAEMQAPPRLGMHWKSEFVRAIARWRGEFVIVPDLEAILN